MKKKESFVDSDSKLTYATARMKANILSKLVNRSLQIIRNASYFSRPPIFLDYSLRFGYLGVPMLGRSQKTMFLLFGCEYLVGLFVVSVTPTGAAPFSLLPLILNERKLDKKINNLFAYYTIKFSNS